MSRVQQRLLLMAGKWASCGYPLTHVKAVVFYEATHLSSGLIYCQAKDWVWGCEFKRLVEDKVSSILNIITANVCEIHMKMKKKQRRWWVVGSSGGPNPSWIAFNWHVVGITPHPLECDSSLSKLLRIPHSLPAQLLLASPSYFVLISISVTHSVVFSLPVIVFQPPR